MPEHGPFLYHPLQRCPVCEGKGIFEYEYVNDAGYTTLKMKLCRVCLGDGRVVHVGINEFLPAGAGPLP